MIEFMVIALPRSGTTWAANWLCTDTTLCIHDPLYERHYAELDHIKSKKRIGVSCTGLWRFPKWVNGHTARKVILHRSVDEINESLTELGFPAVPESDADMLDAIEGIHVDWRALFDDPKIMYEYLLDKPFDAERHQELKSMAIQPEFATLKTDRTACKRLMDELRSIAGGN